MWLSCDENEQCRIILVASCTRVHDRFLASKWSDHRLFKFPRRLLSMLRNVVIHLEVEARRSVHAITGFLT